MLKSTYILIFIGIYFIKIVHNQLIIRPTESIASHDEYKPFIALCTGQGNTRAVTWQSPSQIDIEENSNARVIVERKTSGLRLRIRNLTRADEGKWTCLGSDHDGKSFTNTLQLFVKVPITFVSEPIQYAELNSAVLIKCRVIANPSAEISWYKGVNKDNLISSNYEQKDDGLKINRVSLTDNDIFWCQADVIETGESKEYQIQIILAHGITSTRIVCVSPCAVDKRTANLICEANGMPPPSFSWFYGENSPLNGLSKFVVRGNRLIINYVDETDNGRYSCHAFNDYDKKGQKAEYMLNVIIPPHLASIPPMEINFDENFPTQKITFSCRLERGSTHNLSLEWLYANNTLVQPINGISIDVTQLPTSRLIELKFDPVRREHHGNYTCLAKNLADTATSIAQLTVKYKPVLIKSDKNEVYSVPNYRAIMKCRFDSFPPPIIQWIKTIPGYDNKEIILDDNDLQVIDSFTKQIDQTIYESQLTYNPSEEDFGYKFQCRANNSRIEKYFITLRRAEPPQQVRIIEVKPKSYSIDITVQTSSETGGLPLLHYIVKYEQVGASDTSRTTTFPAVLNDSQILEVKSLQPTILYRIQIAAESHAGQSAFSIPVQATTLNGDAPSFNLLNETCMNKNSYLVKWFIEDNGGTPISRVEIYYAKIRGDKIDKPDKINPIAGQTTEYELKNLKKNTNYSITVRLYNKANYTERTTNITCHTKSGPQKPSIWIIIAIIAGIIITTIIFCVLLIFNRAACTCVKQTCCAGCGKSYSKPPEN